MANIDGKQGSCTYLQLEKLASRPPQCMPRDTQAMQMKERRAPVPSAQRTSSSDATVELKYLRFASIQFSSRSIGIESLDPPRRGVPTLYPHWNIQIQCSHVHTERSTTPVIENLGIVKVLPPAVDSDVMVVVP